MTTETKRDLTADLAICGAATAGPWETGGYIIENNGSPALGTYRTVAITDASNTSTSFRNENCENDAVFIAEARTGWPHAIQRAMAAKAEVERLRKYAGFLRSVIRCGERLPDDYSIADFERTVSASAPHKETGCTEN